MNREDLTGLVLAGGLGRRMSEDAGGVDKGLLPFGGRPLVTHVIERLAPQVGALIVNANRNLERYAAFGHPVVPDALSGFAGPLAGLHAGLRVATTRFVVTAPCDTPFLPRDLVERLASAAARSRALVAVARAGSRAQPVFMLVDRAVRPALESFLRDGGRKVDIWHRQLACTEVDFDDERAFLNINTLEELKEHEPR